MCDTKFSVYLYYVRLESVHVQVVMYPFIMAALDPRLWETLQEFSQNLAIWTSRRMLVGQTGN